MNIMDLEEAEGLTAEMVRGWLERNGWKRATIQNPKFGEMWLLDGGAGGTIWIMPELGRVLRCLVALCDVSPQRLLREMNPRMRRGLPSMAERKAQQHWICVRGDAMEFLQVKNYPDEGGLFRSGGMGRIVEACYSDALFWPCDAHGNKVRWPKVPA